MPQSPIRTLSLGVLQADDEHNQFMHYRHKYQYTYKKETATIALVALWSLRGRNSEDGDESHVEVV